MIRWRTGEVVSVGRVWDGAAELRVRTDGEEHPCRALAYPRLVGHPEPGDRVVLNTTALAMGLGTGSYALVIAVPERTPPDAEIAGHLVKARYTPLQATVLGADEQGSPHHEALRDADDVGGMPVVTADLHYALPAVLAGLRHERPASCAVYVMTDGGALPLWFSRTVAQLRAAEVLAGSVTVGQAFGADLEAVTLHTGLLAARHVLGADVAVVTQGPGNLGTGTRWGFSGTSAGEAINAAATLGGRPVASLRVSEADRRERHRGVSHHSLTAYGRVAFAPAEVVIPEIPGPFGQSLVTEAEVLRARHTLVRVRVEGLYDALQVLPVRLSTMGRGLDEDLAYFLSAAAAGRHAARLIYPRRLGPDHEM